VKESYNVTDLPTTFGAPFFKDNRAAEDAVAVARLKAAGAIVMGKTDVPLMLGDWQSYNDIYGMTRNPWNLDMSPGGSSGGSAAALAAGFASLELGSDIGGSIRVPAHFCGVFRHKPSYGVVPGRGQSPIPIDRQADIAVCGPLARSAEDLALALDILAGPDRDEAVAYRLELPPPRHTSLRNYRVLVLDQHPLVPTDATVRDALDRLAGRLSKAGVRVSRASKQIPDLAANAGINFPLFPTEIAAFLPENGVDHLKAKVAALSPQDDSLRALWLRSTMLSHREWIMTDLARGQQRARWRELFHDWDVVLCPPFSTPAFRTITSPTKPTAAP